VAAGDYAPAATRPRQAMLEGFGLVDARVRRGVK